jgi:hypothetical protein
MILTVLALCSLWLSSHAFVQSLKWCVMCKCVRSRAGFYVVGNGACVKNFLFLFDEFVAWIMQPFHKDVEARKLCAHACVILLSSALSQVHIFPGVAKEVNNDMLAEFEYGRYKIHDSREAMPLKWYECQPVAGNSVLVMSVLSTR